MAGGGGGGGGDTAVDSGAVAVAGVEVAKRSSNVVTVRFFFLSPSTSRGSTCAVALPLTSIVWFEGIPSLGRLLRRFHSCLYTRSS